MNHSVEENKDLLSEITLLFQSLSADEKEILLGFGLLAKNKYITEDTDFSVSATEYAEQKGITIEEACEKLNATGEKLMTRRFNYKIKGKKKLVEICVNLIIRVFECDLKNQILKVNFPRETIIFLKFLGVDQNRKLMN